MTQTLLWKPSFCRHTLYHKDNKGHSRNAAIFFVLHHFADFFQQPVYSRGQGRHTIRCVSAWLGKSWGESDGRKNHGFWSLERGKNIFQRAHEMRDPVMTSEAFHLNSPNSDMEIRQRVLFQTNEDQLMRLERHCWVNSGQLRSTQVNSDRMLHRI